LTRFAGDIASGAVAFFFDGGARTREIDEGV
jgi:hypothetical protein